MVQVCFRQSRHEQLQVLDAAVDQVNLKVAAHGPRPDPAVGADVQVGAFNQRDAKQLRQVAVLEERRAVLAVGQQHAHRRIVIAQGGEHFLVSGPDVIGDDVVSGGQLRDRAQADFGAFHLVGDARRYPQVVLQDDVAPIAHVDQVDAVDMHEHVPGRAVIQQFRVEILAGIHHVGGNHLLLAAVQVQQETVDRLEPLGHAAGYDVPFSLGNQARHPVGGHGAKLPGVQHEREGVQGGAAVGVVPTPLQFGNAQRVNGVHQVPVNRLHGTVGVQALVERMPGG